MTNLNEKEMMRAHNLFVQLKKQPEKWFKDNGVTKCNKCNGTGLSASKLRDTGGYSWDTTSYCNTCYGVGFIGLKRVLNFDGKKYMCPKCQTVGCHLCNRTGFVDWITHIMRKVKK